jgi:hypothetical protein
VRRRLRRLLAALLVGFIPPPQFGDGNGLVYFLIVGGGALGLGLLVPFLFYRFRKPSWRRGATRGDRVMSDQTREPRHHNRFVYIGAWVLLVAFTVIALSTFNAARSTRQAGEKADRLIALLEEAGVPRVPS